MPDLNCDLGEGEAPDRTAALLRWVDSANIACGGHAGDAATLRHCLLLARDLGAHAGAHPGLPSRGDFGRGHPGSIPPDALVRLLQEQVGAFAVEAARLGVPFHHIKLHGALYHAVDADPALSLAYVREAARNWPGVILYARAGGPTATEAGRQGVPVWEEGFLDRAYANDGSLVPRGSPGAVLDGVPEVLGRLEDLLQRGGLRTQSGGWLPLKARTWCVHGDSPATLEILGAVRSVPGFARMGHALG